MTIREPSGTAKIPLSENARVVLERRYLAKDAEGRPVETPEQMFQRVAHNIAQAELLYKLEDPSTGSGQASDAAATWEERFYELMARVEFLPHPPPLKDAGQRLPQLSALLVLAVADSNEGIFQA